MLNDILDAVIRCLEEKYPECKVVTDSSMQEIDKPCFLAEITETSDKPMLGRRFFREAGVHIRYIPDEPNRTNRKFNELTEQLMGSMEYIVLAGESLLRGTKKSSKVSDGQLDFYVTYGYFSVKERETEPPMEEITAQLTGKDGIRES